MEVTVRELRANLAQYLKEGCIVVDGKTKEPIAKIITPSEKSLKEKYELQAKYIKQLESQKLLKPIISANEYPELLKPIISASVPLDDGSTLEDEYPGGLRVVEKYLPQKCQFYRNCNELSVGIFTLGQVMNGSWVEVPFKHLCQKHADFVAKDKEANWDL